MYQVMLVDDEESVLEGLSMSVAWEELGVETVYKATSGRQALALLERQPIDVVITDIRMPGLSGLQLIETIREKWKRTKCILLSGYAEFQYAKQALETGTEDYLLKPASDEDVERAVRRVLGKLQREWEETVSAKRAMQALREHLPLLRTRLLRELLTRSRLTEAGVRGANANVTAEAGGADAKLRLALAERLELLGLPLTVGDDYALVLVRLEEDFREYDNRSYSLFQYAIGNMAEELFAGSFDLWPGMDDHEYMLLLVSARGGSLSGAEAQNTLERLSAQLQNSVKTYLKGAVSVVVGRWMPGFPSGLRAAYDEAVGALFRQASGEREMFLTGTGDTDSAADEMSLRQLYDPPQLIHLFEAGRWAESAERLARIMEELGERFGDSPEHIREAHFTIAGAFMYIAHKHRRLLAELTSGAEDGPNEGTNEGPNGSQPFRTVRQLREWAFGTLDRVRANTMQEVRDVRAEMVRQIQKYVENHLDGDVSLQAVADHVHLHPVYLSKVYKLETGEPFTEYLYRLRMNKAAFWLKSGAYKVYEISAMLGYQNTPYFIKKFKKYFGKTPQEYRES